MLATCELEAVFRDPDGRVYANPWPAKACPLSYILRPGDGVLDLGANVGEYTRDFAARVGPSGFVLAVEPDPQTALACTVLARSWPWVHVVPAAVASQAGVARLWCDARNARRHSLCRENLTNDSSGWRAVPALALDQLAASVPNLRAIKVDIQGGEAAMLAGARETLARTDVTWWVELWPLGLAHAGSSAAAVLDTFNAAGLGLIGTTWDAVRAVAKGCPHGVQNIFLQHQIAI